MKRIMLIFVIMMMSVTFVACNNVNNSVNSHSDKITKIEIHREPNKMDYSDNDNVFDSTGMQLKVYYSGGTSTIISSGFTCYPNELDYDGLVVVTYQGIETELFVNYIDNRPKYIIPDIMGLSQKAAESKLKSAGINYTIMDSPNAYLAYDDVSPSKTVNGYGGYYWNEEEDYYYICEGEVLEVYISQPAIYITKVSHDINSAGGVNVYIDFVNNSNKTIKYIKFNDVEFYNTVADPAYCEIKKSYKCTLNFTGPLYAGDEKHATWEAVIYNNKTSALVFRTITVDFTDGTSQTINYDAYWHDNRYIGGYPG